MSGGTPCLGFARSNLLGTIPWIPLVEWLLYGPRTESNQWLKFSMAALSGDDLGFMLKSEAPSYITRWHRFQHKGSVQLGDFTRENSISHVYGREVFLRPICICLYHKSKV
jgi:hypothetical protein